MEIDQIKNTVQEFAIEKWIAHNKVGTLELLTQNEKTFIFLKALYTMPKDDRKTVHLFLSDTLSRERRALAEIQKFNEIFNLDVLRDYNLQFFSYGTVNFLTENSFGLVCCDEFHKQLTPNYVRFHLNNKYQALLTATTLTDKDDQYGLGSAGQLYGMFNKLVVTKEDMLNKFAPIFFKYKTRHLPPTDQKANIFVIKNKLDNRNSVIKDEKRGATYWRTEQLSYDIYKNDMIKLVDSRPREGEDTFEFQQKKAAELKKIIFKRNKFLYSLVSKRTMISKLLFRLRGKSVIYGNDVNSLEILSPGRVLSMKNADKQNELIKNTFRKGHLRSIGVHCDTTEKVNLADVDNCIIKDYYGSEEEFLDRISNLRAVKDKPGNVFVIVTEDTQEVPWFNNMVKNQVKHNYILCDGIDDAFNKYTNYEDD